jgi:Flp pilus assembly protein TadD
MKKTLIVLVALLAMVAFVSVAVAQKAEQGKTTTTTTTTTEKTKAPKALKVTGAVAAYEAGKTITVKTKDKELAFDIAADAKVKGKVKEGAKVTVTYKKDGDKMVATAISVAAAKKAKAPKAEKK